MTAFRLEGVASFGGLAFVVLLGASFGALAEVGTVDGGAAARWQEALRERGSWAQLSGYLHALAGLSLAAFAWRLLALPARRPDAAVAAWGRFAALAWAASFVLGGVAIFASAELAGYQDHAEGAKTALVLGHLLYANPVAALLGGAFAFAVGLVRPSAFPEWFGAFGVALGGLGMAATVLGSVGGIGLLGLGPVALWLVVAAALAPWRARAP